MKLKNLKVKIIICYSLICICFSSDQINAQDMNLAFDMLNNGEYAMAEKVYKNILESDQYSAELYYNLGMANYYQQDVGEAVLYLEKALKYKPNYKPAKTNLKQVKSEMTDAVYELKPFFIQRFWNSLTNFWSIGMWRIFSFIFLICSLFGTYHWLLNENLKSKKGGFVFMIISVLLLLMSTAAQFSRALLLTNNPYAVVTQQKPFYEGPNELSLVEDKYIPEGTKVMKLETYDEWIKVRLPDAEQAYLKRSMMSGI